MQKKFILILSFMLTLATQSAVFAGDNIHRLWDQVLTENVITLPGGHATQFDYQAVKKNPKQLTDYLAALSAIKKSDFDRWGKDKRLAFLINAYNAFTVKWIIDHYPIDSIKDTGSFFSSPWSKKFISLFGQKVSLDTIEHDWIRGSGKFNDPRIHFAVNCASVGCPALREEAYTADKLAQQLAAQATRFMSDRSRNYADKDVIYLSAIFDWYEEDFEQGWYSIASLYQFVLKHKKDLSLNQKQTQQVVDESAEIDFLEYDWSLNDIKSR
ncbi:DUF547 domain-containing protein [Gayadomonas joobiniege]|uniref:DUF547 domain-containing protein n=1 Tax=Gayadomonas joobiniege TaxID=1234606 RepID=UPI00036F417A|nr:DUF547 domain-containing protein [Gayadomonas joobiniege]